MGPMRAINKRLPTLFPNFSLALMPLKKDELKQVLKTGWLKMAAFRTTPKTNKIEIKKFLQSVYGMEVEKVHTINYDGKKKRTVKGYMRTPAWKKAYVYFKPPSQGATQNENQQHDQGQIIKEET